MKLVYSQEEKYYNVYLPLESFVSIQIQININAYIYTCNIHLPILIELESKERTDLFNSFGESVTKYIHIPTTIDCNFNIHVTCFCSC